MNEETLLKESLDFIKANLDATFDAVPSYLRDFWMIGENEKLDDPSTTKQGSVFMYALLSYKKSQNKTEFRLKPEELFELFNNWQLVLSLAEINEKTDIKVKPIKLFHFDDLGSEIEKVVNGIISGS